jgi:hypothetical protein
VRLTEIASEAKAAVALYLQRRLADDADSARRQLLFKESITVPLRGDEEAVDSKGGSWALGALSLEAVLHIEKMDVTI